MPRNPKQDENLKKGKDTQFKSGENAAINGRKGGIISGEVKRANKSLANLAKEIAQQPAPDKLKGQIHRVGLNISDDDMTCKLRLIPIIIKWRKNSTATTRSSTATSRRHSYATRTRQMTN